MWKRRIDKNIKKIRGEISILAEILQGRCIKEKKKRALMRKYTGENSAYQELKW